MTDENKSALVQEIMTDLETLPLDGQSYILTLVRGMQLASKASTDKLSSDQPPATA